MADLAVVGELSLLPVASAVVLPDLLVVVVALSLVLLALAVVLYWHLLVVAVELSSLPLVVAVGLSLVLVAALSWLRLSFAAAILVVLPSAADSLQVRDWLGQAWEHWLGPCQPRRDQGLRWPQLSLLELPLVLLALAVVLSWHLLVVAVDLSWLRLVVAVELSEAPHALA